MLKNARVTLTRSDDAHKGTCGHVLVVAGAGNMSGAAALTGLAALRGGAGLVTVACPEAVSPIVAAHNPALMVIGVPTLARGVFGPEAADQVAELARSRDVVALGPGLTDTRPAKDFVTSLLPRLDTPVVLDADGLNCITDERRTAWTLLGPKTVITPHPGEMARLTGLSVKDVQADREGNTSQVAQRFGGTVVLKGSATVVANGKTQWTNNTGGPGLATAGSGDVLTGLIAALLAQGLEPMNAACAGVHIHGLAGDIATEQFGPHSVIATDVLDCLGPAFQRFMTDG